MPKKITFTKYQTRQPDYHWQQIRKNLFTFNAFVLARYQQIVNLIPKTEDLKILDIGCGDGVLIYLINKKTQVSFTGIDPDPDSLKAAQTQLKTRGVKAKLIKASAYKLPFKSHSFDMVISAEIIEHLDNPTKMLSEIKRVLNPVGTVIITTPIKLTPTPKDKLHVREYTQKQLKGLLKKYFNFVTIYPSHPYLLAQIYNLTLFRFKHYHLDIFRWLINLFVLIFKLNPFKISKGKSTQQLAIAKP